MLAADLITATRRHLYGSQRVELNKLNGAVALDDDTITVANAVGGIVAGAVVSVGLEDLYVWSVADEVVTVQRGYNGSAKSTHADGDLVSVNSRYTDWELMTHLNNDLNDLCAPGNGLYQIRTLDLTAVSGQLGYDFPAVGFLSIADARWKQLDSVTNQWWPLDGTRVEDSMPTDQFPSGTALFIDGRQPQPGQTIRIRYRAAFDPIGSLSDDVAEVTGLPLTALDLPPMGAAVVVMAGRPVGRAQYTSQGDTRRATEVSVGDVLNSPAALRQQRATRIAAEAGRLAQQWERMASRITL